MLNFPIIATLFYSFGINEKNIISSFKNDVQLITVKYNYENIKIKIKISENIVSMKNETEYSVHLKINSKDILNKKTDKIKLFYDYLLETATVLATVITAKNKIKRR